MKLAGEYRPCYRLVAWASKRPIRLPVARCSPRTWRALALLGAPRKRGFIHGHRFAERHRTSL